MTVESKVYTKDMVAKGAESQDDNVAKIERDEASGAKIEVVTEKEDGKVPQLCDTKADVEQVTEAHNSVKNSSNSRLGKRRCTKYSASNC